MKKISKICIILIFGIMTLSFGLSTVTANGDIYYPWTNPDKSGFKVIDYYRNNNQKKYCGQMAYEWKAEYIPNNHPNYDYYAIYVRENVNPARNQGYANGKIRKGTTTIDLKSSNLMVLERLPDRSSGSTGLSWGFGISGGMSGEDPQVSVSFGITKSYSVPDVDIDPSTNSNWGGQVSWAFKMKTTDARKDEHTFRFTAIIRAKEGAPFDISVTIWTKWSRGLIYTSFTESFNVKYDGTPSSSSGGGKPPVLM